MKTVLAVLCLCGAAAAAAADLRVRVMTYNIHHGAGLDEVVDLERIAAIIRAQSPDVVCLQEVDQGVSRSKMLDTPAEMAKLLDMRVVYGPNLDLEKGLYGNATLTRFDIVEEENIALPTPAGLEPRGCLRVRLRAEGRPFDVFNTHLGLTPEQRVDQAAAILAQVRDDVPSIAAGDFNETLDQPAMQALTAVLLEVPLAPDAPPQSTLVNARHTRRIDFVLASKEIRPLTSAIVVTSETQVASDHFPVVADVVLPPASPSAEAQGLHDDRLDEAVGE